MQIIILLVVFAGMMYFMQRSQKKQQQKREDELNSMTVGSEIVTIGGLHGVLAAIDKDKGTIELDAEGVILTFDRAAVRTVKAPAQAPATSSAESADVTQETSDDQPVAQ